MRRLGIRFMGPHPSLARLIDEHGGDTGFPVPLAGDCQHARSTALTAAPSTIRSCGAIPVGQGCLMPPGASPSVPPLAALMPMGSEESDDPDSDKRHGQAKSDHNKVEHSHDAPGRITV
jgi:hypothetical protein